MEKVAKNIVNKISNVNLINNTTTCPCITVNSDRIADSGSTLHCYRKDMLTDYYFLAAALHDVKPDRSQIVSTLQTDMKVSTFKREARRGYKFPTLTPNLVLLPVRVETGCAITLDKTSIKVTKSSKHVIAGYREQQTILL